MLGDMSVILNFLYVKGKVVRGCRYFPPATKQMDTFNGFLLTSDLVSLHCAVTKETLQILNLETFQHIKTGNGSRLFQTISIWHYQFITFSRTQYSKPELVTELVHISNQVSNQNRSNQDWLDLVNFRLTCYFLRQVILTLNYCTFSLC